MLIYKRIAETLFYANFVLPYFVLTLNLRKGLGEKFKIYLNYSKINLLLKVHIKSNMFNLQIPLHLNYLSKTINPYS